MRDVPRKFNEITLSRLHPTLSYIQISIFRKNNISVIKINNKLITVVAVTFL